MIKTAIHKYFTRPSILAILILVLSAAASDVHGFFENPIGTKDAGKIIEFIADFVVVIGIPVLTVFLILSGLKFVTAQGNPQKLEAARKTFYYTILGAVIIVGANVITKLVVNFIKSI